MDHQAGCGEKGGVGSQLLNREVKYSPTPIPYLLVNQEPAPLDACFAALADPTRRTMLQRLQAGEASVSELAEPFAVSLPAVMKHIRVLEEAGLVTTRKHGRTRHVRLRAAPLGAANAWLSTYRRFWDERLDALQDLLELEQEDNP